jgi:hypothetical protein
MLVSGRYAYGSRLTQFSSPFHRKGCGCCTQFHVIIQYHVIVNSTRTLGPVTSSLCFVNLSADRRIFYRSTPHKNVTIVPRTPHRCLFRHLFTNGFDCDPHPPETKSAHLVFSPPFGKFIPFVKPFTFPTNGTELSCLVGEIELPESRSSCVHSSIVTEF